MRLILILIIIYLIMQNPDMKKKVEDFFHNLSHSIKKTSEDIQDQVKQSANDVTKEMSDSVKDIHK
jgi:hypothetical protein